MKMGYAMFLFAVMRNLIASKTTFIQKYVSG